MGTEGSFPKVAYVYLQCHHHQGVRPGHYQMSAVNTAQRETFLGCVGDNFRTQLVKEPTRKRALLDLLLVNREGLGDVTDGRSLGSSDHEIVEFLVLREIRSMGVVRMDTLVFCRTDFGLCRRLFDRIPWEAILKDRAAEKDCKGFKGTGAGHPYVPKDKLPRKETFMAE